MYINIIYIINKHINNHNIYIYIQLLKQANKQMQKYK